MTTIIDRRARIPGKIDSAALSSFTPAAVASCVGWFDVSYEVGLSDNDLVSLWTDRVAINGNMSSSDALRPTYKTNIVNGLPIFRFAGAHMLSLASQKSYANGTWFFIIKRAGTANNDYMLGDAGSYSYLQYGGSWYSTSGIFVSVAFSQDIWKLKCVKYDGVNHTYYTNGTQDTQASSAAGLLYKAVGANGYAAYYDVAEVVFCNAALSDTDRGNIETYFNRRYALW